MLRRLLVLFDGRRGRRRGSRRIGRRGNNRASAGGNRASHGRRIRGDHAGAVGRNACNSGESNSTENYNLLFYKNWYKGGDTGDCANFVSQCLTAGGISHDSVWGKDIAGPWRGVPSLKKYLSDRFTVYSADKVSYNDLSVGDLVFYGTSHVAIITKASSNSFEVCGHTSNRKNYTQYLNGCGISYVAKIGK